MTGDRNLILLAVAVVLALMAIIWDLMRKQ
jgi:hypothetical protein